MSAFARNVDIWMGHILTPLFRFHTGGGMVGGSLQGKKTNTFLNLALRVPSKDRKAILELWGLFHQANKLVQ